MRFLSKLLLCCIFPLFVVPSYAAEDSSYQLSSGDVISISVFGEENLSFSELRLTDAGTLSFPFLGEVGAKGRTAAELEQVIINGLIGDYLIDPKVSISVLEYREFFVNGEVKKPGGYSFQPGLTLRKVIALAGGLTDRASERKMFVIRDTDPSREPVKIDMESPINAGDIITIEKSFF